MTRVYCKGPIELRLGDYRDVLADVEPDAVMRRFLSKVDVDGECWVWTGWRDRDGYGQFAVTRTRRERPHRLVMRLTHGDIKDAVVMHTCDNPACLRPSHLRLGTQVDNIADMDSKGRRGAGYSRPNASGDAHWKRRKPHLIRRGEAAHRAKLSAEQVREIRARINAGETHAAIAADYPISKSMVSRIRTGKAWGHL